MEEPIQIKNYVLKTEVARKLQERIKEELLYTYIGIGGAAFTYFAIVLGGVWLGIIPLGIVGVAMYLRIIKLRKGLQYIKDNYAQKIEPPKEFI